MAHRRGPGPNHRGAVRFIGEAPNADDRPMTQAAPAKCRFGRGAFGARIRLGTISVCMIARDEEEVLGETLRSLRGLADELIFVDTGSRDGTLDIARGLGPEVAPRFDLRHFTWRDDFAAARNESLRGATGEWICYIDADERVVCGSGGIEAARAHLLRVAVEGVATALWVSLDNFQDAGQPTQRVHVTRAVRNWPNLEFSGIVHEQPTYPDKPVISTVPPELFHISHRGYTTSTMEMKRKFERNTRLLLRILAANPADRMAAFYLGAALQAAGRCDEALRYLALSIGDGPPDPAFPWAWLECAARLADCLRRTGRRADAFAACMRVLAGCPLAPGLWLQAAQSAADHTEARRCYLRAAETYRGLRLHPMGEMPDLPARALADAALCSERLGDREQAVRWYGEATADPNCPADVRRLCDVALARLAPLRGRPASRNLRM